MNFSTDCKISISSTVADGAAGQTTITGNAIDMQGFDSCCFVIPIGPITAGAATSAKAQQSDDSGGSPDDFTDLTGTNITIADTDDNTVKYLDIFKPRKRYVRLVISRATQNATIGGVIALQSGSRYLPVTHGSNVSGERHASVAEGTA